MRETASADARREQFVRGLYFDLQRIDGVKSLEIWNGVREFFDSYEKANLVKNLYKIALPIANEACFGRPFPEHGSRARSLVEETCRWFVDRPDRLFDRFPDPPLGDPAEKGIYVLVRTHMQELVKSAGAAPPLPPAGRPADALFPDGLFDFREMRIVENEMPYIIFTDKEFRVIHGLAAVYLWLVDLDALFCATLASLGVDAALVDEYRKFVLKVHRENPLTVRGRKMDAAELSAHIHEKLQYEDYLDLFEDVYRWFDATRKKLGPR